MTTNRLTQLKEFIAAQGWRWSKGKAIPHGEQIIVTAGEASVPVNFYPKRGKLVLGGADSPLKAQLAAWGGEAAPTAKPSKAAAQQRTRLDDLKEFIRAQGWDWGPGGAIDYGEQIVVTNGPASVQVNFFPKRGKMQIQGRASSLKTALQHWANDDSTAPVASAAPAAPATVFANAHIGMDESGKGDWFGPLVVAAVYADAATLTTLRRLGVRDSKTIERFTLPHLAAEIKRAIPSAQRVVWRIAPEQYNQLYAQHGNINLLLAEAYAQAARRLADNLAQLPSPISHLPIVCDQFSQRTDRLDTAFAKMELPRPVQQHHAEDVSIAVAAASILATTTFAVALEELAEEAGYPPPLPAGASDSVALEAAAYFIIAQHGPQALGRYAKLNFKPVQKLLGEG